jgi:hypothetical protein
VVDDDAAAYTDGKGRLKTAFYPGQVFVRHSSKTDPARGEDVERMLREATGEVVRQLGAAIQGFSGEIKEAGIPVTLGAEGLFQVSMKNPNEVFPYTAKTLGEKLGKHQSWVARAVRKLGIITKPEFCWAVTGASAAFTMYKYNEAAYEALRRRLDEDPDFNPFE